MDHSYSDKHIVLMTATGQGNLGDELILSQEVTLLQTHFPQVSITIFSHDIGLTQAFLRSQNIGSDDLRYQEYFPNHIRQRPIKNILHFIRMKAAFFRCDVVIIGGGGLLYETESEGGKSTSPVLLWKLRTRLARFFRKKIIYWSLGVSTDEKIDTLFGPGDVISVRDEKSQEILRQQGVRANIVPDPVFLLRKVKSVRTQGKHVGLALRRKGFDVSQLKNLVSHLDAKGYTLVGLPHSYHPTQPELDDKSFMESAGIRCVADMSEVLTTYGQIDSIITNRFHGVVLGLVHDISILPITVNEKIVQLTQTLGITSIESIIQKEQIDTFLTSPQSLGTKRDTILGEAGAKTKHFLLDPLCDLL